MQGIADRFDLSAKINACVYCQSLINPFNIDIKSELGCENLFPFYPWLLLPLSAFLYNESIKTQGNSELPHGMKALDGEKVSFLAIIL